MHCSPTFCRLRAKGSGHFCKPAQLQPWIAGHTLRSMTLNFRGQVHSGRLIVNEPIDLPDGSEVTLSVVEDGDELDDEDRARLHEAIRAGQAELDRGEGIPATEVIAKLRAG